MIIDANLYWFDERIFQSIKEQDKFLADIPKSYGMNGYIKKVDNGDNHQIVIEKPTGYQNLNYIQGEYVLEKQLAALDQANVDKAIMKIPGCHEFMSLEMCKQFNNGMADYTKRSHGRLIPLIVIPPYGIQENIDELKRCREELNMHDIQLCAHYGEHYLDSDIFKSFFEELNQKKTTVYIHHTPVPVEHEALYQYNNLRRSYGRCVDQTTAIGREIFSGFFEKYPNLTFVHSMLGGGFFSIANMMFPKQSRTKEEVSRFEAGNQDIIEIFKKHIYFEMSHAQPWGKEQLECAIKVLGADHIIFGTSYPVRKEWLAEGVDFINALDISNTDKNLILGLNAQNLYHID